MSDIFNKDYCFDEIISSAPSEIERFIVELTTTCNLACQYCHRQKPDYKHHIMPQEMLRELLAFCTNNNIRGIDFTGGGETTLYAGWKELFDGLIEKNIAIAMTSNFSRDFSDEEIQTLSHFTEITVSMDTADSLLLKKIRGADLKRILLNLTRIRALCLQEQRRVPKLVISVVFLAEIVESLMGLFSFAKVSGVEVVNIQELVVFNDVENDLHSVWELAGQQAVQAAVLIERAFLFAEKQGLKLQVQGDFYKRLAMLKGCDGSESKTLQVVTDGLVQTHSELPGKGQTRNCLDPWRFVQVMGDGQVRICCMRPEPVGLLQDGTLSEILNGDKVKRLRRGLLTGNLDKHCRICHWREAINIDDYRGNVLQMKEATFKKSKIDGVVNRVVADNLKVVFYGAGQFAKELLTQTSFAKIKLVGIVDSNPERTGQDFEGYIIADPASIKDLNADIIVIASGAFVEEIEAFLVRQDLGPVEIFKF